MWSQISVFSLAFGWIFPRWEESFYFIEVYITKTCFYYRAVFNWVLKIISWLLWCCITTRNNTTLCDWLKHLAPLSQTTRSKTKTYRDLLATRFPRLPVFASCSASSDWFIGLSASVLIDRVITLVLVYTTLNGKPLYHFQWKTRIFSIELYRVSR